MNGIHPTFGCLVLIAAGGCGTPPQAASSMRNDSVPSEAKARRQQELVRRADELLARSWPLDYHRPFTSHDDDISRSAAMRLYVQACRSGDKPSCWVAATLDRWGPTTTGLVQENCLAGDLLSCRALPIYGPQLSPNAPGSEGRSPNCQLLHPGKPCDLKRLQQECMTGFLISCRIFQRKSEEISEPEEEVLETRISELWQEGCRARLDNECKIEYKPSDADARLIAHMCPLGRFQCDTLADSYSTAGDHDRARDLTEQLCQYGGSEADFRCFKLAVDYLSDAYPEPVPGRGDALFAWLCPQLENGERLEPCKKHETGAPP